MPDLLELTGSVIRKQFAAGSKSEHAAVFLATGEREYKLERAGGNPFQDDELERLAGSRVVATGSIIAGHTFRVRSWQVLE